MKKQLIIIAALLFALSTFAQEQGSYLIVGGGVGASGLKYDLTDGSSKLGLGFHGNIGYSYFFTRHWGLGTGVQFSTYQTTGTFNQHLVSFEKQIDPVGDMYRKDIYLRDWEEVQKQYFVEIPLLLQFQHKFGEAQRIGFYANAGVKVQIPVQSTYSVESGSIETQGYYEAWHALLYDLPQWGFDTKTDYLPSGDVKLKPGFAATGELGLLFTLSKRVDLYLGGYVDYGFTSLLKEKKNNSILSLNNDGQPVYHSMLASNVTNDPTALSYGGKIGLRIRLGKSTSTKTLPLDVDTIEIVKQVVDTIILRETTMNKDTIYVVSLPQSTDTDKPTEDEMKILTEPVFFDLNKREIIPSAKILLNRKVTIMERYPKMQLLITGNTCDIGSETYNVELGQHRATAVKKYMESLGISRLRVSTATQSFTHPIAPNTNEENREKNRRCDFYPIEY